MKKPFMTLFVGASLFFCQSAFALSLMTEAELRAAYGQAGVSIVFDYIYYEQTTRSIAYTDDDGTTGEAGSVVIGDTHIIKIYNALTSSDDYIAKFEEATNGVSPLSDWNKFSALTIDTGECPTLSAMTDSNLAGLTTPQRSEIIDAITLSPDLDTAAALLLNTGAAEDIDEAKTFVKAFEHATDPNAPLPNQSVTGVVAGLPTLLINTTTEEFDISVAKAGAINDGCSYIHIKKEANVMAILGGTIEIAAH